MAKQTKWTYKGVRIRERTNTAGSISYRVEYPATIKGKRTLVQFKTKGEAEGDIDKAVVDKANLGTLANVLTAGEREDAASALELLRPFKATLTEAAEFFRDFKHPSGGDHKTRELVAKYLEGKKAGTGKKKLRDRSLSDLRLRLDGFSGTFGDRMVATVRTKEINEWLHAGGLSDQTKLNNYRVLFGFFKWATVRKCVAINPMLDTAELTKPAPESTVPLILKLKECEALLNAAAARADLGLLPYVTLGMFCGIRSAELAKLQHSHLDLDQKHITIPPEIAKKRRIRIVDIPDNALDWLRLAGKTEGPIRPEGFDKRFRTLVKAAKLKTWPPNALRHTAGSMHYQYHLDAAKTCAMLGQKDDAVLFTHYRSLVSPVDAKRFYSLRPEKPSNVLKIPAAA